MEDFTTALNVQAKDYSSSYWGTILKMQFHETHSGEKLNQDFRKRPKYLHLGNPYTH